MVLLPPDDLPELGADLVATLTSLNVHNFSHAVEEKRICKQDNRISFNNDCISFAESRVLSHHLKQVKLLIVLYMCFKLPLEKVKLSAIQCTNLC